MSEVPLYSLALFLSLCRSLSPSLSSLSMHPPHISETHALQEVEMVDAHVLYSLSLCGPYRDGPASGDNTSPSVLARGGPVPIRSSLSLSLSSARALSLEHSHTPAPHATPFPRPLSHQ